MNSGNVRSMHVVADLHERRGNTSRAKQLRGEATQIWRNGSIACFMSMAKGYWRCGQPDGTFNEVRHCYDFLAVVDNMADDLTPAQKQEMSAFFWRELHSEKWMRALAQGDADSTWNIRPDHSCLGAYAAWPPMTAKGLYKIDSPERICALAARGGQGWQSGSDWPSAFRGGGISASQWRSFQVIGRCALHRRLVLHRWRRFYGTRD